MTTDHAAALKEAADLDEATRRSILDFEDRLAGANHFDLLGLQVSSSPDDAKKAYHDLSKRFHPDRFFGKKLGTFQGRLDRIFRALTEAHQVLTSQEKRSDYLKSHPELLERMTGVSTAATPRDPRRDAERRSRFAQHPYLAKYSKVAEQLTLAKSYMAQQELGLAFHALSTAVAMAPTHPEATKLLEEVRVRLERKREPTKKAPK